MAKRATVNPRWLDELLSIWGRTSDKHTGWYGVNPMLKSGIPMPAVSQEPTGYCAMDFRQLESAIESLELRHKLVLVRCYKPWTARAVEDELKGYGMPQRVWVDWLHEAASLIESHMSRALDAA